MLLILFITKGILSAVGVILARGHSCSVLTAFSLAWSGFLHPWLPVGWLAGIVEAHYRPPMTEEFKKIMKTESGKYAVMDFFNADDQTIYKILHPEPYSKGRPYRNYVPSPPI
jgi:pheromone shutdown protein TraB